MAGITLQQENCPIPPLAVKPLPKQPERENSMYKPGGRGRGTHDNETNRNGVRISNEPSLANPTYPSFKVLIKPLLDKAKLMLHM